MSKKENGFSEQRGTPKAGKVPIAMEFIIRRWVKRMAERRLFPPASVSSDVWASANGQVPKPAACGDFDRSRHSMGKAVSRRH